MRPLLLLLTIRLNQVWGGGGGGLGRQRGTVQVGKFRRCVATNKICFKVSVYM
jgi:hypothetical protein